MRTAIQTDNDTATPWHRQFWPWFLIALPGSVVIACIVTAVLALRHDDSRVVDNYYKEGLAINQQLGADRTAQQLGLQAQLRFDADGSVALRLGDELTPPAQLQLQLIHPLDSDRDLTLRLEHLGGNEYAGQLAAVPDGRWHLHLGDPADNRWRLRDNVMLGAGSATLTLRADADATPENR